MTTYTTAEFAKAAMLTQEETETFKRGLAAFLGWTYFANKSIQDMLTTIEENGYIATIGEGGWPIMRKIADPTPKYSYYVKCY
jgi:hypothetical protein